jgi:His/Glu/Gln/Arg/opine family amino acid ABC transporter permease subunit
VGRLNYQFRFDILEPHLGYFAEGMLQTTWISILACGLAAIAGLILGVSLMAKFPLVSWPARAYVEFFRNTPVLVQIIWIYYAFPIITGINTDALTSVILALALSAASMFADIFRAGINGVDPGEVEAARSLGMSYLQTLRRVILPQAVRLMIPPFTNMFIVWIKYSSLVSVLGVADLTYRAQLLSTITFRPLEIFTFIAVLYFILSFALSTASGWLERRLAVY